MGDGDFSSGEIAWDRLLFGKAIFALGKRKYVRRWFVQDTRAEFAMGDGTIAALQHHKSFFDHEDVTMMNTLARFPRSNCT